MNETLKVAKLYLKYHSYFNPYPALKAMSTAALHDNCCGYKQDKG